MPRRLGASATKLAETPVNDGRSPWRDVRSWRVRITFLVLWMLVVQTFFWTRLYYTGDEPAYMMSVLSFVQDGDFNLFNNYLQGDANLIEYPGQLHPQWSHLGYRQASLIPAEHGTAFLWYWRFRSDWAA
jgi:hypothetical protein